jgi:predicted RNase H-like HicB family nuclease
VTRRYVVILTPTTEEDEVGYTVTVPALPGCVTEGDTMDEALGNAREAISLYVESLEARGLPVPPSDEVVTSVEVDVHATALSI